MHSLNAISPSICVARDKDSNKEETLNNVQSFYPSNGIFFFLFNAMNCRLHETIR